MPGRYLHPDWQPFLRPAQSTCRPLLESGRTFSRRLTEIQPRSHLLSTPGGSQQTSKQIIPVSFSVTVEKHVLEIHFFFPLNLKACNPRACRNLIKTLCEWNCLRNLLYVLNRGRGNTWLGRICLGLLLCFTTWYIHLFTTQLTGLWHSRQMKWTTGTPQRSLKICYVCIYTD